MNYPQAIAWLYQTQQHGIKLGLENIRNLLAALDADTTKCRYIHVAGTNGKGSVCAMLDSICRQAGLRTGLYTSPHLVSFCERIRVNGRNIPEETVTEMLTAIRHRVETWETHPTFFEITTALGLKYFQDQKTDIVILETGMGGRMDATNIVTPIVSVITPIGMDHQKWLGNSITEIANEKAGIIKPEIPVVSAPQSDEAKTVLKTKARETGSDLTFIDKPLENIALGLKGKHQAWNAALALRALKTAQLDIPENSFAAGLADVSWPGRFQYLNPKLITDGAHNPMAATTLVETWQQQFGEHKATLVIGILKDKDVAEVCKTLIPLASHIITTTPRSQRAFNEVELKNLIRQLAPEKNCIAVPDLNLALQEAEKYPDPILVTGSLFLVGELLAHQAGQHRIQVEQ